MPNTYHAPYRLSARALSVPSGQFTVPVCTTPERFDKIMNALWYYGQQQDNQFDFDHLIDWLQACNHIVEGCTEVNPVCRTFAPTSELITWSPENPYHPDEEIPATYPAHPFTIADNSFLGLITWGLGYKVGDVFTDLSKTPDFTDPENINTNYLNLPSFTIHVQGEGTVKAHLLSIPFGGRIIIIIDEQPVDLLNLVSVELHRDSLSFPPETAVELVIDTEVRGAGAHTIRYVWYPVIELALPPIAFGGGFRSFELCGFEEMGMAGENCCEDELRLLNKNNLLLDAILTVMKNGFKIVPVTDDAIDAFEIGTCLPDHFDADADDTGDDIAKREDVLCWVTQAYVYSVMLENLALMGFNFAQITSLWDYFTSNPFILSKVKVNGSFLTLVVLAENIASLGTVLDAMTCTMLAALKGKQTSYIPFRDSVPLNEDPNPFVSAVYNMVYYSNHQKDNFTLFCNALEQVMNADVPEGWTCPCVATPPVASDCDDISLVDFDGTGCTIEYISDCIWKFTQNATALRNGIGGAHHFSLKDVNGLDLLIEASDQPTIGTTAAVGGCIVDTSCGAPDYNGYMFGGGFVTTQAQSVKWWQASGTTVTYLKVTAYTCP